MPSAVSVTADSYDNEVSWKLSCDRLGAPIVGGSPYFGMHAVPPGSCTLVLMDSYGDGWQGGWFRVFDQPCSQSGGQQQGSVLVGAPASASTTSGAVPSVGAPENDGGVYAFSLPGDAPTPVCVHIHTGRWPQEYDWNFDNDPDNDRDHDHGHCSAEQGSP